MNLLLDLPAQLPVAEETVQENRARMREFTRATAQLVSEQPMPEANISYEHKFSDKHEEFGCHMYSREMFIGKGTTLVGRVHNHPTMNILLSGKIAVMSETGIRVLEAPQTFMSPAGAQKIGFALEDCVFVNVILTKEAGDACIEAAIDAHTTMPPGAERLNSIEV